MKVTTLSVAPKFVEDLSSKMLTMSEFQTKLNDICSAEGYDSPADIVACDEAVDIADTVQYSVENCSADDIAVREIAGRESSLYGYHEINGFPFYGYNAWGDWEVPVYGIIYMKNDDDRPFMYTPIKGNSYNPKYNSAYGNNDDYDDGEDAVLDYDAIVEDIKVAFNLSTPAATGEAAESLSEIVDDIDELVEAVSALSDEAVEDILREGMKGIVEKISEALSTSADASELADTKAKLFYTETQLTKAEDKVKDLETQVSTLDGEIKSLKKAAATPVATEADKALDEIAKIISSVKSGAGVPTPAAAPTTTAPAEPAKPLKKISLPSKSLAYKYFYGVQLDCGRAILHIVKEDDWARDELAKEGRVDTETIARLKKELPMKRDMFVYNLEDSFDTVEEAVKAVDEAAAKAKVNLTHSKDVQAKL